MPLNPVKEYVKGALREAFPFHVWNYKSDGSLWPFVGPPTGRDIACYRGCRLENRDFIYAYYRRRKEDHQIVFALHTNPLRHHVSPVLGHQTHGIRTTLLYHDGLISDMRLAVDGLRRKQILVV